VWNGSTLTTPQPGAKTPRERMKKTHYKQAIDRLFEQWPYSSGFDPEKDITAMHITPAEGEEGDNSIYAHVECECWPEDVRFSKPKMISVTFNLSKK